MRYFLVLIFFIATVAHAQLINTVEVSKKILKSSETEVQSELLHTALMKSIEKFSPELGFKFDDFQQKLNEKFKTDESSVYSRITALLRSHKFLALSKDQKDETLWIARVELDLDKAKLESFLKKIVNNEVKPFSKIYIVSEITPLQFDWKDLTLENEQGFLRPLNESWKKWESEHLPNTVEEVLICETSCLSFYRQWTETHADDLVIPEEFQRALFLKTILFLRKTNVIASVHEISFEWEGRALLQEVGSKKILGSMVLAPESRSLRQLDQKLFNSNLASSLYRTPISAFMDFNHKLGERTHTSQSRVTKLTIKGQKNIGDVMALSELIKARATSLGITISLGTFSKDEAILVCSYHGEEKSFTDFLSAIKELKSSHSYNLVNEFSGVHHVIRLVTE